MKKLFAFICLMVCIILTGCDGGNYTVILNSDGSVTEIYAVLYEMKQFTDAGAQPSEYNALIAETEAFLQGIANTEKTSFENRLSLDGSLDSEAKEEYKKGFSVKVQKDDKGLYLVYDYPSAEIWEYYLGVKNKEPSKAEIEESFFTSNIVSNGKTKFASPILIGGQQITLGEYIYLEFETRVVNAMGREVYNKLEEFPLSFSYATTSHRLHSDADEIVGYSGYYVHTWNLSRETVNREIKLYLTEANRSWWYLIAFGTAVIAVAGCALTFYVLDKRKKESA